jgi:hypothetical protein
MEIFSVLQPPLDNMSSKKQMIWAVALHNFIFIQHSHASAVIIKIPSKSPELNYF